MGVNNYFYPSVFWRDFSIKLRAMTELTRGTEATCIQQLTAVCFQHKPFLQLERLTGPRKIVFHCALQLMGFW